jgi:hypothetical protein
MNSQIYFEPLNDGTDQAPCIFYDDSFFDFNSASSDSAPPAVESLDDLPSSFMENSSFDDLQQPHLLDNSTSQSSFFDSFASDDTFSSFHSDMSVWPTESPNREPTDAHREWSSSPPTRTSDIFMADPSTPASQVSQITESPRTTPSMPPMGPIEAFWRPIMGSSPQNTMPFRTPQRKKLPQLARTHTSPKPKVTKVTKKAVPKKRTTLTQETGERSIKDLYSSTWESLTQEEKGRLLLPLLQGIDPNTGKKITKAGTLLPPPNYTYVGANFVTNQTTSLGGQPTPSDFYPAPSQYAGYTSVASPQINDTTDVNLEAVEAFNRRGMSALDTTLSTSFDSFDSFSTTDTSDLAANTIDQGLGGPCGNGIIGDAIHMPTPPAVYGSTRQQEALDRNAMLRAQGRRR